VDIYFVSRGRTIFEKANRVAVVDGFFMGVLRSFPASAFWSLILQPLLAGSAFTLGFIVQYNCFNLIGNGVEAAITAPLAIYIAHSVSRTSTHEVVAPDADVSQERSIS